MGTLSCLFFVEIERGGCGPREPRKRGAVKLAEAQRPLEGRCGGATRLGGWGSWGGARGARGACGAGGRGRGRAAGESVAEREKQSQSVALARGGAPTGQASRFLRTSGGCAEEAEFVEDRSVPEQPQRANGVAPDLTKPPPAAASTPPSAPAPFTAPFTAPF